MIISQVEQIVFLLGHSFQIDDAAAALARKPVAKLFIINLN